MAHCPYCGVELEEGGTCCDLCGDIPAGNDPLNDTAPFVPTYDAMEELRRTRKFTPDGDASKPALEEPTSPLPEHIQRALDDGAEVSEKATVVARPIPGRQLGSRLGEVFGKTGLIPLNPDMSNTSVTSSRESRTSRVEAEEDHEEAEDVGQAGAADVVADQRAE